MFKLLQLSTYGIKNLEKMITINFANSTVEGGIKKINKVKGIYGYNGAGKSALIEAAYYYQQISLKSDYLLKENNAARLEKLINYKRKEFYVSMVFSDSKKDIFKHEILIKKDELRNGLVIEKESLSRLKGRTLDDKYEELLAKEGSEIRFSEACPKEVLGYMTPESLRYSSFGMRVFLDLAEGNRLSIKEEDIILKFTYFAANIQVFLLDEDKHINYQLVRGAPLKNPSIAITVRQANSWMDFYADEVIIDKEDYPSLEEANRKLERFIQLFKPSVKEIRLQPLEERGRLHVRRSFVYDDYPVDLEFESSGIKQLVKMFPFLFACANGAISFIDEMDANINSVYLEKMVSFFREYGEGQLIFTSHNLETMNALKAESRSIVAMGDDGEIDTWVKKGNRTPKGDYVGGYFPSSPMNIEDFDFISIFQGEDQ